MYRRVVRVATADVVACVIDVGDVDFGVNCKMDNVMSLIEMFLALST